MTGKRRGGAKLCAAAPMTGGFPMHVIKKIMIRLCVVLAFVIALESTVRFCYEAWKPIEVVRLSKEERGELKGTLDTVYCGTSVTYYAFNPWYLDEQLGTSSFNLATSAQPVIGSYYLVRDAAEENPIQRVYLMLTLPALKSERTGLQHVSAYTNMRTWKWKLRYLLAMGDEDTALSLLFYSTNVDSYLTPRTVLDNIRHKLNPAAECKGYVGKGFRSNGGSRVFDGVPKKNASKKNRWNGKAGISQVDDETLEYLRKLGSFCGKNGIDLSVVIAPPSQAYLNQAGDLDDMDRCLRELTEEIGADYYNFILYRERTAVFTDDKFKDWQHFNMAGSEAFNRLFAEVVQSERPEDYFFSSMAEFG